MLFGGYNSTLSHRVIRTEICSQQEDLKFPTEKRRERREAGFGGGGGRNEERDSETVKKKKKDWEKLG